MYFTLLTLSQGNMEFRGHTHQQTVISSSLVGDLLIKEPLSGVQDVGDPLIKETLTGLKDVGDLLI